MTAAATSPARTVGRARSPWRAVAVPTEHGGWGLTAEPAVLGVALVPSGAGVLLAVAAVVAFLARTPLRVALVDHHRDRTLDRTRRAWVLVAVEGAVLALLVAGAIVLADGAFWIPAAIAAPLVAIGFWFDTRSRSRRLAPELAGACGIASVVAMIVLAGGGSVTLAAAAWLVLAARAATSIPHARACVARLHRRATSAIVEVLGDLTAIGLAVIAVRVDGAVVAGSVAVALVVLAQRTLDRNVTKALVLGARQSALGVLVVVATAIGAHLW